MRSADISGISPNFLELSQSRGQVAHVLLTRSPLGHPPEGGASFDLHVLSTPPAFVLSQDQTLRRCLNHGREPRVGTRDINQPKEPTKGLLLGTDFRHAVEFSRSGRATNRPSGASSSAGCPLYPALRAGPRGALPAATIRRPRAAQRRSYVRVGTVSNDPVVTPHTRPATSVDGVNALATGSDGAALDAGDVPPPAAQDQPAAGQPGVVAGDRLGVGDPLVVQV